MKYRVTLNTTLTVTVDIEADNEDAAADEAWKAAEAHTNTLTFSRTEYDGALVRADATFDGIGADTVEPAGD